MRRASGAPPPTLQALDPALSQPAAHHAMAPDPDTTSRVFNAGRKRTLRRSGQESDREFAQALDAHGRSTVQQDAGKRLRHEHEHEHGIGHADLGASAVASVLGSAVEAGGVEGPRDTGPVDGGVGAPHAAAQAEQPHYISTCVPHMQRDMWRSDTDARMSAVRTTQRALAPFPFAQPFDRAVAPSKWLVYDAFDVFRSGVLAWQKLGQGAYGAVMEACAKRRPGVPGSVIPALDAKPHERRQSLCASVNPDIVVGAADDVVSPALVAVKLVGVAPEHLAALFTPHGQACGVISQAPCARLELKPSVLDATIFREILAGGYALALVRTRATPHLAVQHCAFFVGVEAAAVALAAGGVADALPPAPPQLMQLVDQGSVSGVIVQELCDLTLAQLLPRLRDCDSLSPASKTLILRSLLFQCAQALASMQANCNWRHNDLHGGNVMITMVPPETTYTYILPAAGDYTTPKQVTIPSYGLSARIIDFGTSTGDLFGAQDTPRAWANEFTTPIHVAQRGALSLVRSMALLDFATLHQYVLGRVGRDAGLLADIHAIDHLLFRDASGSPPTLVKRACSWKQDSDSLQFRHPKHPELSGSPGTSVILCHRLADMWQPDFTRDLARAQSGVATTPTASGEVYTTLVARSSLASVLRGYPMYATLIEQAEFV